MYATDYQIWAPETYILRLNPSNDAVERDIVKQGLIHCKHSVPT